MKPVLEKIGCEKERVEIRAQVHETVGCEKEKQRNLSSSARIRKINKGIRLSIDEIVDRNISKWRGLKLIRGILIFVFILLTACSNQPEKENSFEAEKTITNQQPQPILQKLKVPWALAKHKDTFYISERDGTIVSWNETTNQFHRSQVKTTKPIHHEGEGGFLGIELTPNFEESHQAYAYHTYQENGNTFNRVIRIQKNGETWDEVASLLEDIPGSNIHNGGRIKIGPDQKLYVTIGDAAVPENAQNLNSLSGKISRMELDGRIPSDNPFKNSYIYSYGHRNPQGLAWDEHGTMYSTEHGQSAHDEINLIKPGANYGWPIIEGNTRQQGMETPIFQTGDTTWAPSGIQYKDGKLYIATLRGEKLRIFDLKEKSSTYVRGDFGRIRDVYIERDNLYFISNNLDGRGTPSADDDQLWKVDIKEIR
ncbi:PQQ-dependent sugar dehydrogenase [Heyndrickxia sporothermodurans]|uniref:PQQ-dependent sugar dehydrogenase n=1 Tax=Heyndrickxia sporothermodurans TaxID=46224 RepID=UPI002DBF79E0|nr:PQQ-dependent sugar dehydrogenase [Heyndrickxia sporothermodurans]MEB6550752.1 PQQ-dependent sugar dehydrogenase [Heyndrickxia sporothermodurans]